MKNNRGPRNTWRRGALGLAILLLGVASLSACNDSNTPKFDAGPALHRGVAAQLHWDGAPAGEHLRGH